MSSRDQPIPCAVDQIDGGIGSDCELSISCNNQYFKILLSRKLLPDSSLAGSLLRRLDAAVESQDELEMNDIEEEIAGIVCEACQPIFRRLAPAVDKGTKQADLQTFLNPQISYFQLAIVDGNAKLIQQDSIETISTPHYGWEIDDQTLSHFLASDIQVLEEFRRNAILKVSVRGEERCCKLAFEETRDAIKREFECLKTISESRLPPTARVPRLIGLVQSHSNSVIGILEEYVNPSSEAPTLGHFDIELVAITRRRKWASQIRETVMMLHKIGVIWGDGKADNILVDADDNAWVVDFGGSWTNGWVDKELAGTVQGDEQALRKIDRYLNI